MRSVRKALALEKHSSNNNILETDATNTDSSNLVLESLIKGHSLRASGILTTALTFFENALLYDNSNTEALVACGECFYDLGQFNESFEHFKKALFIEPENRYLWRCCCQSLALTSNFFDAIQFCESMLSKWPDCGQTHILLAKLYQRNKDFEKAKSHYHEALFLGFNTAEVCFDLGLMLLDTEQPKEAAENLSRSIREGFANPVVYFYLGKAFINLADNKTAVANFNKYLEFTETDDLGAANFIKSCDEKTAALPPVYIKELFDQYADNFDESLVEKLNYTVPTKIADEISKIAAKQKIDILDLGCGTGLAGEAVKNFAQILWGIDISPNMVEIAKNKNIYDDLIVSNISEITIEQKFDVVIAGDVLVYFGELETIFSLASSLLKSGGYFIASVESDNDEAGDDGFIFKESRRFGHNHNYIESLAKKNNFSIHNLQKITPRYEKGSPLNGYLFTLHKI
ncbi:MAG: methyltransferase domain-containing protein [Alphaproteobacteria bacterium]